MELTRVWRTISALVLCPSFAVRFRVCWALDSGRDVEVADGAAAELLCCFSWALICCFNASTYRKRLHQWIHTVVPLNIIAFGLFVGGVLRIFVRTLGTNTIHKIPQRSSVLWYRTSQHRASIVLDYTAHELASASSQGILPKATRLIPW
jgi:hypothetical protein